MLEVWSYETKRLLWDRPVGENVQKAFDGLLSSIFMSELNIDFGEKKQKILKKQSHLQELVEFAST